MAKNNEKTLYIMYTEEEGGDYHVIAENSNEKTQELFNKTVESKVLLYSLGDGGRVIKVKPAYIALVTANEDFDFVLDRSRIKGKEENDSKES